MERKTVFLAGEVNVKAWPEGSTPGMLTDAGFKVVTSPGQLQSGEKVDVVVIGENPDEAAIQNLRPRATVELNGIPQFEALIAALGETTSSPDSKPEDLGIILPTRGLDKTAMGGTE